MYVCAVQAKFQIIKGKTIMKKRFIVFSLILALLLMASSSAYGLEVVGTTPKDGFTRSQPQNMAVKIKFDEQMVGAADIESNAKHFKITDPDGKEQSFSMVYSEKYPNELWLILDENLQTDTEYKVSIGAGIVSAQGNETKAATDMSFKTRNTSKDNTISTIMMICMMGLMVVMTVLSSKKKAQENQVLSVAQAEKLNPYKIAKQKKWSLEQAQAYVEKEKEKARKAEEKALEEKRKREAITAAEMAEINEELDSEERRNGWFRVKSKETGSFKAHGHAIPKKVLKKNAAKRKAEEERAKKYAKNKKKK